MSWVKTISLEEATGKLKKLYKRITGPNGHLDNILTVHSLRPHSLEGHMSLYKNVLHHNANQLEKHQLEALGVYVSMLNKCSYCVEHHFQGYKRLINDDDRATIVREALESDQIAHAFGEQESSLFAYAKKLTLFLSDLTEEDLAAMRTQGYDDGIIVEVNQVVAYFNYANRTVLGLGVSLDGDILGLSPNDNDDENNWGHS